MLLALDIGNTVAKVGLFDGGRLVRAGWIERVDGLDVWLEGVTRVACASVAHEAGYLAHIHDRLGAEPLRVHAGLRLPFAMAYATPETLGADRLAAAAGAAARHPDAEALLVIDAGTAVTLEVIAGGVYRGGAIAPGPELLRRALATGTARLPDVPVAPPDTPVGRSTVESIRVGVTASFLGGVERMRREATEALAREGFAEPTTLATGGWADLLSGRLGLAAEPHLVLHGIAALAALNPEPSS